MATITRRAMVGAMLTAPAALAAGQAFARQNAVTHKVLLQAKGRVALVNEKGEIQIRLCCGHQGLGQVYVHELVHAVRLCQALKARKALAADCLSCVREELLAQICGLRGAFGGALCAGGDPKRCIEGALTSCRIAAGRHFIHRDGSEIAARRQARGIGTHRKRERRPPGIRRDREPSCGRRYRRHG